MLRILRLNCVHTLERFGRAYSNIKYSSDQYHKRFDPKTFIDTYYESYNGTANEKGFREFFIEAQFEFWSNYERPTTSDEVRCLDYGGGPTISTLISAAPKVDRIVFAEFTEACRQAVLSWIAGKPEAFDWKPVIKYVCDREGDGSVEAVLKREEELKKKLKSVVCCDVHTSPIIDLEGVDKGQPFDVVTTTLCLESCVASEEHYKSTVAELSDLIKPSGYLRMDGVLGGKPYYVGKEAFYSFPLTKALIEDAMHEAEFEDIKMEVVEARVLSDRKDMYTVFGRKSGRD